MTILIGIDGGGTGCRAIVADVQGNPLGYGSSGAANIMTNFDGARDSILKASKMALNNAGIPDRELSDASVFMGLAGANVGDCAERMIKTLPFNQCQIDTDAVISLQGAIGNEDGVVAIIGTGSVFIYRTNKNVHTVGGWGFMVGDLGSGSRLGRSLLQETLLCFDGIHNGSALTHYVLSHFEHDPQTIVEYAHMAKPGDFGKFAPAIFDFADQDDPIAKSILGNAVRDIENALDVILTEPDQIFCMLGGLSPKYVDLLNSRFSSRLSQPLGDAASGAVALAVQKFSNPDVGQAGGQDG
ncbi:MAG: BadF/BadG/BcrA/BcrD ATPase family protein [Rhizobiaceae bacterium]